MGRDGLTVDVWTWINAMLAFASAVLLVYVRDEPKAAMWIGGCIVGGTILTVLGRLVHRPSVPMTVATAALLTPWLAVFALFVFWSLAGPFD